MALDELLCLFAGHLAAIRAGMGHGCRGEQDRPDCEGGLANRHGVIPHEASVHSKLAPSATFRKLRLSARKKDLAKTQKAAAPFGTAG
jgi:hypothetical protein